MEVGKGCSIVSVETNVCMYVRTYVWNEVYMYDKCIAKRKY